MPVLAEAELGLRGLPACRTAAITGTNGKTTTTALTAHLLVSAGLRAVAAGNIGRPLSAVALEAEPPEWLAVELSSFQLHDMPSLTPTAGVLTNLSPDHLDRYATLQDYYADKALLFRNAAPGIDLDHERGRSGRPANGGGGARHAPSLLGSGEVAMPGTIATRASSCSTMCQFCRAVISSCWAITTWPTRWRRHSRCASPMCRLEAVAEGLRSFRALPHRLEPIREVNGVLWINDSKATNIASTAVALAALERRYVLLLGGRHKGESYQRLAPILAPGCRAVVAYGEAAAIVEADLGDAVRVVRGGAFDEVLAIARTLAEPGDAVLLSPACSSYDMFLNYEERGAAFRAAVESL